MDSRRRLRAPATERRPAPDAGRRDHRRQRRSRAVSRAVSRDQRAGFERGSQFRWQRESDRAAAQYARDHQSAARKIMVRANLLVDSHGRILRDLRVSITDRCNFRCLYCLPETEAAHNFYRGRWAALPDSKPIARQWQPKSKILTFEEIERVVRVAAGLGIQKVRLTGGEPLLRTDVEDLVSRLAVIPGIEDLAMTSNGFLFQEKGRALRDAGLRRISFSLDSLDRANFQKMTGRDGLEEVLASIRLARELGMDPVKVNAVIIRGINDHEIEALAEFARGENVAIRFIEFMPLDSARAWLKEIVVPGRDI